ncbi:hypothetical protein ES332_A12G019100v1 [Gossypium tomentosum]|uniref:Uncharacterized protein n=1 Tax=Gossypium tomentosum TaxID=34277 RepID=A0A5D2MRG4_GOSTO|nr:hypothetical protein ES332_A12G019100v1 [Gossypium tomentosum]
MENLSTICRQLLLTYVMQLLHAGVGPRLKLWLVLEILQKPWDLQWSPMFVVSLMLCLLLVFLLHLLNHLSKLLSVFHPCFPLFKIGFLIAFPWFFRSPIIFMQGQLLPWFVGLLQIFPSQCLSLVVLPLFSLLCRLLLVLISRGMNFLSLQENQLLCILMMRMEPLEKMLPYAVAN